MTLTVKSSSTATLRKGLELLNHLGEIVEIGGKLNIKTELAEIISQTVNALENLVKNSNTAQAGTLLRDIKEKLANISCLIVHPPNNPVILNRFSVDIYESLQELYLYQCPPSTITNFTALQVSLVNLVISSSGITDLGDIFVPPTAASFRKKLPPYIKPHQNLQISSKYCWNRLVYLSLANCGLTIMDESFHFFPSLVELDISHNDLRSITHLQDCIALEYINASHNRIDSLHHLERTIGHVKRLNVAHNQIVSLEGVDKIYSLEEINIMHNEITDFLQIQYLARLPNLESILLANNPLTERRHYRLKVYREFVRVGSMMTGNRDFPELDKAPITRFELHKLRKFMFRAPTDAMVESSFGHCPIHLEPGDDDFDDLDNDEEEAQNNSAYNAQVGKSPHSSPASAAGSAAAAAAQSPTPKRRSVVGKRTSTGGVTSPMNSPMGNPWRNRSVHAPQTYDKRYSQAQSRKSLTGILSPGAAAGGGGMNTQGFVLKRSKRVKHTVVVYDGTTPQGKLYSVDDLELDLKENAEEWQKPFHPPRPPTPPPPEPEPEPEPEVKSQVLIPIMEEPMGIGSPGGVGGDRSSRRLGLATPGTANGMGMVGVGANGGGSWTEKGGQSIFDGQNMSHSPPKPVPPPAAASSSFPPSTDPDASPIRALNFDDPAVPAAVATTISPGTSPPPDGDMSGHSGHTLSTLSQLLLRQSSHESIGSSLGVVDCYAGDRQYRNLLVMDNLELYFREQVFSSHRPTYPDLYLQRPRPAAPAQPNATTAAGSSSSGGVGVTPNRTTSTASGKYDDYSLHFLAPFHPEEKFITFYTEKVIVLKSFTSATTIQAVHATSTGTTLANTQTNSQHSTATGVGPNPSSALPPPSTSNPPPSVIAHAGGDGEDVDEHVKEGEEVMEIQAVIIVTDMGLYLLNSAEIHPKHVFADTPLFTALVALPLMKLTICTIYFSFQRCALQFLDPPDLTITNSGNVSTAPNGAASASNYHTILGAFMIMTREKARTHPIITKIPQLANAQRQALQLHNVKIENKDEQLLSQLSNYYSSIPPLVTAHDIQYYQLVYQVWRKKPGYKIPRSLIITPKVILLCTESWSMIPVTLQVYEWYLIKDISKIILEENQCFVTLIFKRFNMLSGKKKWRLYNEVLSQSMKCYDAVKQACMENGNPDV